MCIQKLVFQPRYLSRRLCVEQYRLIQELCGGMGVVGVTDDVGVTDVTHVTDITDDVVVTMLHMLRTLRMIW